jgi:hypothetical protein
MKLFDKKAERKVWVALLASIPFLFFVLWKENGNIGMSEIAIATITLLIGVGIMFFIKWYSNKQ